MKNNSSKKNFKSGFVSIIGRPNVGKSTLMNSLVGEKIAIMSDKPQTTRNQIRAIYNDDEMQIVFPKAPKQTRRLYAQGLTFIYERY